MQGEQLPLTGEQGRVFLLTSPLIGLLVQTLSPGERGGASNQFIGLKPQPLGFTDCPTCEPRAGSSPWYASVPGDSGASAVAAVARSPSHAARLPEIDPPPANSKCVWHRACRSSACAGNWRGSRSRLPAKTHASVPPSGGETNGSSPLPQHQDAAACRPESGKTAPPLPGGSSGARRTRPSPGR